ncbi:MAG: response regulator transcription factor [Lachnospiraceae bacterium]|nr:response regulator transcription factor [Lachnospiraceae bacterium]
MKQKIYLVEDDKTIQRVVRENLEKWDYEVIVPDSFDNISEEFANKQPDLVIMDISLPFKDGFYWTGKIRENSKVPIIFLSSMNDKMNMVMAVRMGADDFIPKPFDLDWLLAKIDALLRRTYEFSEAPSDEINYNGLILGRITGNLKFQDLEVHLTPQEVQIVSLLLEKPGQPVTKETIINKLWESEEFISQNSLTVTITRLRKKLSSHDFPTFIHTVKEVGYMAMLNE